MVNWYYVQGSERLGPVKEENLRELFQKEVLHLESYVWRKGFANWEKLKDVSELDFSKPAVVSVAKQEIKEEIKQEIKQERREDKIVTAIKEKPAIDLSPEVNLSFEWPVIRKDQELFFIKIGHDRKSRPESLLFGPYSLKELEEALAHNRINNKTLIFAAGMLGWVEVGQTPLNPEVLQLNTSNILDETPLLLVVNNEPLPLITLVLEAGIKKCTLLGAGPFKTGSVFWGTIYSGKVLKAKNVKLTIDEYNPLEQKIICNVNEISDDAKKIMQNYAN
jgi:hypothetical protein